MKYKIFHKIDYRIGEIVLKYSFRLKWGGGEDKISNFINIFIVYIQNI